MSRKVYVKSVAPEAKKVFHVDIDLSATIIDLKSVISAKLEYYGHDQRYGINVKAVLEPFLNDGVFVVQDKPNHWFDLEIEVPDNLGTDENCPVYFSEKVDQYEQLSIQLERLGQKLGVDMGNNLNEVIKIIKSSAHYGL